MAREKIFGQDTVSSLGEVRDAAGEVNQIFENMGDSFSELSTGMQDIAKASKAMLDNLSNSEKYSSDNKNLAKDQAKAAKLGVKYATSTNIAAKIYRGIQIKLLKGGDEFTDSLKESVSVMGDLSAAAKSVLPHLSPLDAAFENIGSSIGGFISNPLTAAVGLLTMFEGQTKAIAKQFGGMGVTDFRDELTAANQQFVKLGLSSEEAQQSISTLANTFGMSLSSASELSKTVSEVAVASGLTVDESSKLVGLFTQTQGLTGEQAKNLLLGTRQLAKANGVAPDKVLSDIASDTELFARFSKDGGENILRAAVQARKLGISISTVAKSADGLLDFQNSLNSEIEASILLGREVNLQKARELSLNNDIEGLQKELVKQVGTEAEFNKLNRIERDALARALNMEVSEIQKLVSRQKEQITLQGEINRLTAENEIPEDSITATAELLNNLKVIGMELAEKIGPGLSGAVSAVASMLTFLDKFIGLGNLAVGVMAALITKSIVAAAANAALAYFKVAGGLGPLGATMLAAAPFAIPLLVGIAAAAISGISGMASAKEGGITTQDGIMQVHKQEAIVPIDRLGGMIADAMKPMAEENRKLREQNETLIFETRKQAGRFADAMTEIA